MADLKMDSKNFLVGDIRLWIVIPIILMVPLNVTFWIIYVENQNATSTVEEPQIATLWGYFQSDIFKGITVSLIIPIFMFLFERRFKILENYETAKAEKVSERKKERREKRWETIKNTEIMWNNLYDLASEVCFFEKSDAGKTKINDLLKKITNFSTQAEDVIHDWASTLPHLSEKYSTTLVDLINYLWKPTYTVASFIKDDIDKNDSDIDDLQLSLGIIQGAIKDAFHHQLFAIIRKSFEISDIIEDNFPEYEANHFDNIDDVMKKLPDEDKKRAQNNLLEIDEITKNLKEWDETIFTTIEPDRKLLPNVDDGKEDLNIKKYYVEYLKTRVFLGSKTRAEYFASADWKNFETAYYSIPHELKVGASKYYFTRQGIKKFADWCNISIIIGDAQNDASLGNV